MFNLRLCKKDEKAVIENLCQFYYYDLDINSNLAHITYGLGRYDRMPYFDNYWDEEERYPYLILEDKQPIGFALVHDITVDPNIQWKLAEFFIMAPFRRKGMAKKAADEILGLHKGTWEISVLKDNEPAIKFWEKVLPDSTKKTLHAEHQNYIFYEII